MKSKSNLLVFIAITFAFCLVMPMRSFAYSNEYGCGCNSSYYVPINSSYVDTGYGVSTGNYAVTSSGNVWTGNYACTGWGNVSTGNYIVPNAPYIYTGSPVWTGNYAFTGSIPVQTISNQYYFHNVYGY